MRRKKHYYILLPKTAEKDFKKAYDSVRREVLYNILIEFGIPMILVRLVKMCLNETKRRVRLGKHLISGFCRDVDEICGLLGY
jgi:hypothetical protein